MADLTDHQSLATEPGSASSGLEVTVLLPCLNEAETLAICINHARSAIEHLGLRAEIVVADNGSTDKSQEIALSEVRDWSRYLFVVTVPHCKPALQRLGGSMSSWRTLTTATPSRNWVPSSSSSGRGPT